MKMRVTDLELFCQDHITRPYWSVWKDMFGLPDDMPLISQGKKRPHSMFYEPDEVHRLLLEYEDHPVWEMVMNRLDRIGGVLFPSWVQHPLVKYIDAEMTKRNNARLVTKEGEES